MLLCDEVSCDRQRMKIMSSSEWPEQAQSLPSRAKWLESKPNRGLEGPRNGSVTIPTLTSQTAELWREELSWEEELTAI